MVVVEVEEEQQKREREEEDWSRQPGRRAGGWLGALKFPETKATGLSLEKVGRV